MNIVVYDLETTGLNARFDQPIQFAALRLAFGEPGLRSSE